MRARSKAMLLAICLALLVGLAPATVQAKSPNGGFTAPVQPMLNGRKWD